MWGTTAVGKLVKGPEPLRPQVVAFVDDEAGSDVAEKVTRRLQHFIDRKVAALFEPLLAMSRDEALAGLARGFAFRLMEALGVVAREEVAAEVKELDQDMRGSLRKHGVRFGQYTIFLPALLKPAPTRLRLVLASLWEGADEFPESPPPGLVTIPNLEAIPARTYLLSGYRPAGARAIRIDMLERLADLLRGQDSRAGFEANPDMLSITGMTLEQFADLMGGLGYKAEPGTREKARPAPAPKAPEPGAEGAENPIPEEASPVAEAEAEAAAVAPEMEAFYTFTWAPRPRGGQRGPRREAGQGDRPERGERPERPERGERKGGGKPKGKKGGGPKGKFGDKPGDKSERRFEARPPKKDKPIDPDNPFAAALMGFKSKS
jgi:ATP-dependent RNA helicase SUPV3L1/SUV3